MNYSLSVFLIRPDVRCVAGIYEPKVDGQPEPKRGLFKTLDPTIKVGDFVLVPTGTRHRMSVNQIVGVDLDVDFDSCIPMDWIIQVVDRDDWGQTKVMEDNAIAKIKAAEKNHQREELRKKLMLENPGLAGAFAAIAGPQPEHPAAPNPDRYGVKF